MSSSFDDLFAGSASQLLDHFGRSVTRYAGGDSASSSTVTAIWLEKKHEREAEYGLAIERTGVLKIDDGATVNADDRFVIDGEEWGVKSLGKSGGFHVCEMVYLDVIRTSSSRDIQ